MAAVRPRYPRPAAVGRRGVAIAIRPPLAVITAPSCNSGLAVRYCSGHLAGPGEPGFAELSAARQEDSTCSAPATQDPVNASVGHSGGTGGPIARPTMATGRTPPARPPPPRTASAAVEPVLAVLQALPSLLSHSPESPFFGEYELREDPQLPPAVPPQYSGPCPDHEPEIPPWGTAVDEAVFDDCVVCGESGRHLQIQCLRCQQMPGCCQCLPMATSQTPCLEFLRCPLCRFEGVNPIQVRPTTTTATTTTTTSSTATAGFLDPNQWPFY